MSTKTTDNQNSNIPGKPIKYHPIKSVWYALQGIYIGFMRETNLWIQLSLGIILSSIALYHGRLVLSMANLIFAVIVMSLEMINTAIELLCDIIEPNYNYKIKIIKDMSAGSILIVSIAWLAVVIYQFISIFILKENSMLLTLNL